MPEKYTALLMSEYKSLLDRIEELMNRNDKLEKHNIFLVAKNMELKNRNDQLEKQEQAKMEEEYTTVARFEEVWDN